MSHIQLIIDGEVKNIQVLPDPDELVTLHWLSKHYGGWAKPRKLIARLKEMGYDFDAHPKLEGKFYQIPFKVAQQLTN